MPASDSIPLLDMEPFLSGDEQEARRAASAFGRTFEEIGFACIVGHGVPEETISRAYNAARNFFDLPEADKRESAISDRVKDRAIQPPDLCEALVFNAINNEPCAPQPGSTSDVTGNIYPRTPPDLAPALHDYFLHVNNLASNLMQLAAMALELPKEFFEPHTNRRRGRLRVVNYPDQLIEPLPGQLRYGAHSDYGSFTILRPDDAPGGLQVRMPNGAWENVPSVQAAFVINIGDLMARWTNDRWKSTLHRVANPPRDLSGTTRRISMAFFTGVNGDAMIECLPSCRSASVGAKYPPVRAADYIAQKLNVSMVA